MDDYKYETIAATFGTVLLWWCLATSVSFASNDRSSLPKTVARLEAGKPTTIVCLGDSVTGVYYHTGGRRAYPEMLQIAISKCYAGSQVSVINSGISGQTTADGIARLQEAVLDHEPDLVTLMYGLNDMTRLSPSTFRDNLVRIVEACQAAGAEVLLCTPNAIEETEARPVERLEVYVQVIMSLGKELNIPVADVYNEFQLLKTRDSNAFALSLSDPIHPNMDGHKRMAETIVRTVANREVSLADQSPLKPALSHTLHRLAAGQPIRLLAMPPYQSDFDEAIRHAYPNATIELLQWKTADKSLVEIEAEAQQVRSLRPDLVVVAIPWMPAQDDTTTFARTFGWVLNWSLSFAHQEWDVVVVSPSFHLAADSPIQQQQEQLVSQLVSAQDLHYLTREHGQHESATAAIADWVREQIAQESVK